MMLRRCMSDGLLACPDRNCRKQGGKKGVPRHRGEATQPDAPAPSPVPPSFKVPSDSVETKTGTEIVRGHALAVLTRRCEEYQRAAKDQEKAVLAVKALLRKEKDDKQLLEEELRRRSNRIQDMLKREAKGKAKKALIEEMEHVIQEELRRRQNMARVADDWKARYEAEVEQFNELKLSIDTRAQIKATQEQTVRDQKVIILRLESQIKSLQFDVDDFQVASIKAARRCEELEAQLADMTADRNRLDERSNHLAVENEGLKEKVRELAEANKEITESHQELQRKLDIRTTELEESAAELEQTKAQYQTTLRSKKQLQADFNVVVKQKQELTEKSKVTESLVARKEKDISDLLTKVNDTIREYEAKLHAKDEEIWAMAAMSEEKQKQVNAIDPGMLQDMEKQFSQKEKGLVGEIEHLNKMLSGALERVSVLSAQNEKLKAYQFEPRMERLKMIEKDVRTKMEEYSVAEETLEVGGSSCWTLALTLV